MLANEGGREQSGLGKLYYLGRCLRFVWFFSDKPLRAITMDRTDDENCDIKNVNTPSEEIDKCQVSYGSKCPFTSFWFLNNLSKECQSRLDVEARLMAEKVINKVCL